MATTDILFAILFVLICLAGLAIVAWPMPKRCWCEKEGTPRARLEGLTGDDARID